MARAVSSSNSYVVSNELLHQYSDKSASTRTFVAMKILTSQATAHIVGGHSPEYEVFRKIESANPNNPGFNHCLTLRQCFTAYSTAGGHICFVTDPLSSSLANLRPPGQNRLTLPIAKRVTKQVLLALDYLHRECGYIHTGGSHPASILIHADDHMLRSQIREYSCFNTSTSNFENRGIHPGEPSLRLWPTPQPGILTFTSRLFTFPAFTLSRPSWFY